MRARSSVSFSTPFTSAAENGKMRPFGGPLGKRFIEAELNFALNPRDLRVQIGRQNAGWIVPGPQRAFSITVLQPLDERLDDGLSMSIRAAVAGTTDSLSVNR